mgnify:CR=1 FL=1
MNLAQMKTALENSVDYREIDYSGKIALVIGNEGNGISNLIENLIDNKLLIPSYPKDSTTSESLNVAVATAIICSEFRRR